VAAAVLGSSVFKRSALLISLISMME
jgi:hypothetical protein